MNCEGYDILKFALHFLRDRGDFASSIENAWENTNFKMLYSITHPFKTWKGYFTNNKTLGC